MAKMTLVNNQHPKGQCTIMGYGDDASYLLLYDVETEVHVKRALTYLGDSNFKLAFDAEELNSLEEDDFLLATQLLKLTSASDVKKTLLPKKKTTTQKVKEVVSTVTSTVTPTTTNDQSTDEADSANDSA
tara:strand:- start:518 stop:907 length:390 start_codon:yes stop_codon:yes gene_type:complete